MSLGGEQELASWETIKPGLWTLDWTVDWAGDDHYQLNLDRLRVQDYRSSLLDGESWLNQNTVVLYSVYGLQCNWRLFEEVCKSVGSYSP